MTSKTVLDTSVLVKIFLQEDDSHLALVLLEKLENAKTKIYCPNLAKIEFISTLTKKAKWGILSNDQITEIIKTFDNADFIYIKEDTPLLKQAFELSSVLGETAVYDCIFLALAKKMGCNYVTADGLFYQKAHKTFDFIKLLAE